MRARLPEGIEEILLVPELCLVSLEKILSALEFVAYVICLV